LLVRGERIEREVVLASERPVEDILNWLEDEYDFHAFPKKIYVVRDDGAEEQIL
jgi:hypothetical protein